jgi:isocitrate lyase
MMEASLHTNVNETDHRIVDISKYTIDDLPRLITELEEVQNRFDAAAVNKSKLKKEYESCQTRLQAAVNVTQR